MNNYPAYANWKLCVRNGFVKKMPLGEFIKENKKYYQDVEDYDWVEVTDHFKGLEALFHRLRQKKTLKLVGKFGNGKKYLDAGCGTGLMLRHLPPGSIGIDINPRNIKRAKVHAPKSKVILGDIEVMPFAGNSFDTVICTDVLEHFPNPQQVVKEIFRVLSPKGILIGSVPLQNPIWLLRFLSSTHPGEPYHKLYQKNEVVQLVGKKGKILKMTKACAWMSLFFVVQKI